MSWRLKSERNWGRLGMKSNWTTATIDEVCSLVTDGAHNSPKSVEKGYYMASVKDFTEYGFDFSNCRQISEEDYEKLCKQGCVPQKDDVLIGKDGARYFEDIIIYRQDEQPALLSSIAILRANRKKITPEFLYYTLKTPTIKKDVRDNYGSGSAIPRIVLKDFKRMPFSYPDIDEQRKITAVCSVIDEKIRVNNAINENLLQQAQALFKSWFVDFEPFNNQKPSDWSVSTLGNVSIMGAGGDKPQNVSPIKSNLCQYPIYSNGLSEEGLYGFTDKPKIFKESVTVSARGTIGFVCLRHIPYVPIVRLVTLIPKTEIISAKYLYLWLKQLHITGTGTTQQQLTVPDFRKTEILVPSQEIVTLFTATVEPIFEKIWANQNENEKLSSLRDTLLPKLMSGELDVSNIDL